MPAKRQDTRRWRIEKRRITMDEFKKLRKMQQDKCALCGKKLHFNQRGVGNIKYCIDHAHECSQKEKHFPGRQDMGCGFCIRGLVCPFCNAHVIPGLEFLQIRNLFTHPYLLQRPILVLRGENKNGIV